MAETRATHLISSKMSQAVGLKQWQTVSFLAFLNASALGPKRFRVASATRLLQTESR